MKAWRITHTDYLGARAIYMAETRAKAKYQAIRDARAADYYGLKYINVRAKRAPEYDDTTAPGFSTCIGWKQGRDTWGCLDL